MTSSILLASCRDDLREASARQVADFVSRVGDEREALYRSHLHATLAYVSPLLADIMALEGVSSASVIGAMAPPSDWPAGFGVPPRWCPGTLVGVRSVSRADRRFARAMAHGGAVIRAPSHPAGAFGVWITADSLSGRYDLGSSGLVIIGGEARLRLPDGTPETLWCSAPGRRLDSIVDHPLLNGRGYVVRRVVDPGRGGSRMLSFRCGLVEIHSSAGAAQ